MTTQVVDLDARIETARTSVERLQEFLGDAASVEDVAALEAELTQRETELEQLVAQQRALEGRVELATVTAVFSEPDDDDAIEGIPGVGSAFRAGLDAFVAVVQIGLVVVAWSLPFLALAAIVAGVVLWWRRRRRAHRIDGPTGPTSPTGSAGPTGPAAPTGSDLARAPRRAAPTGPTGPTGPSGWAHPALPLAPPVTVAAARPGHPAGAASVSADSALPAPPAAWPPPR